MTSDSHQSSVPGHHSSSLRTAVLFGLVALLAAGTWFYVYHVWAPPPGTHISDLYPRWYGSRELLLHHRNPYSAEVGREIQQWCYGFVLDPSQAGGPTDEARFFYPVHVAFVLAPTIGFPFTTVQKIFAGVLPAISLAAIALWIRASKWRPARSVLAMFVILAFFSVPNLQGLWLQNTGLIVALLLAGCAVLLSSGHQGVAGALLAIATIKPQSTFLLIAWLFVWVIADWRARWRLLAGFAITGGLLVAGGEFFLRNWVVEFLRNVRSFSQLKVAISPLELTLTHTGGRIATILLVAAAAWLAWSKRRITADSPLFLTIFALLLAVTLAIIPTLVAFGQVLLIPAVLLILSQRHCIWERGRAARLALVATSALLAWQWIAATLVSVLALWSPATGDRAWYAAFATIPLTPIAFIFVLSFLVAQQIQSEAAPRPRSCIVTAAS